MTRGPLQMISLNAIFMNMKHKKTYGLIAIAIAFPRFGPQFIVAELKTVVALDAVLGVKPKVSVPVLRNLVYFSVGESVLDAKRYEMYCPLRGRKQSSEEEYQ